MYNVDDVTLETARETAKIYMKAGIVPLLISAPGVGKTTLAAGLASELGAKLISVRLNSIPPEEATGLQYIDRDGERSVNLLPDWFPREGDGPTVLFLDELTACPDDFRKGVMSILNERTLGQHKVPEDCYVMAAGNSAEDGTNVYELDRATADRFGVIKIRTDLGGWLKGYAIDRNIHPAVISYLNICPSHFELTGTEQSAAASDHVIAPSPRSWEKVSTALRVCEESNAPREVTTAVVAGKIGVALAETFMGVYEEVSQLAAIEDLLDMAPAEQKKHSPQSIDALWAYSQGMLWAATDLPRLVKVFNLLDNFSPPGHLPFAETRHMIAELALNRALQVHKIPGLMKEPVLRERLKQWKIAANDNISAAPASPGAESEAVDTSLISRAA